MTDYSRIGYLLRKMHENGELARVSLWRNANQTKPGREWFTSDPRLVCSIYGKRR
jgi:hypothetical protein